MAIKTMPDHMTDLPPRQDISAAWLGRDLAKHPETWSITLSPDHVAELERAMAEAVSGGMQMSDITDDNFTLPSLAPVLTALRHELVHGRGFALVRGLDVDSYTEQEIAVNFFSPAHLH